LSLVVPVAGLWVLVIMAVAVAVALVGLELPLDFLLHQESQLP